MDVAYAWSWISKHVAPEVQRKPGNMKSILAVKLHDPEREGDVTRFIENDVVLITGDGKTLQDDVKEFESWGIPHDLYCVNRSLLYFERQIDHWAAIDVEEAMWFTENVTQKVQNEKQIVRHTIGECTYAYDVYWEMDTEFDNELQRRVLIGNSGFFAVLTAIQMGYKKIVIAGMPLNTQPHWYEPDDADGPQWYGQCYTQWMDFKLKVPEAETVRSLGGYSAFILGTADKDWTKEV